MVLKQLSAFFRVVITLVAVVGFAANSNAQSPQDSPVPVQFDVTLVYPINGTIVVGQRQWIQASVTMVPPDGFHTDRYLLVSTVSDASGNFVRNHSYHPRSIRSIARLNMHYLPAGDYLFASKLYYDGTLVGQSVSSAIKKTSPHRHVAPTPTATATPGPTPAPTVDPTATATPAPTPAPTTVPTVTATATIAPTATRTATATATPAVAPTAVPTATATATTVPTATRTATPTATPTIAPTATRTATPTPTPAASGTISATNCPRPAVCSLVSCPTSTNWVNPLNYGAVGNGMTDDTAALQNAENAGDVCFPSGYTFLINSPPVRINTANRHWQAGMTGGAAPVIKNTNSTTGNAMVYVYSNNFSVIGLDFEGANTIPPQWNPNHGSQEWNDAIEIESAGYGLYAGNTFNEWFGDTEIIDYGGSTCGTGHNTIEYNTFKNCGLYGPANDAVMNDTFAHNTMIDCSDGQENDNSSQCAGGSVWNQESVTCYYGMGYQSSMGICAYLTGGSAANGNYSGNTVENSSVSGSANTGYPSSLYKYATGGTSDQATYTNDSCTNGCVVH